MINIAFFNQDYLMQREIMSALKRVTGVRLAAITIPGHPGPDQALQACDAIKQHGMRMLFTVNDWGMGLDGIVSSYLRDNGIFHVNWCADDPFFYETYHGFPLAPMQNRIDFVSDRSYSAALRARGMNAHFLPLAADPALFCPLSPKPVYKRTTCFVGNSYYTQVDAFTKGIEPYIETLTPFVASLYARYQQNPSLDLASEVAGKIATETLPSGLTAAKAVFIVKHLVSYIFRKRLIVSVAKDHPDFVAFGDEWWLLDLPREKVSTEVAYYLNLSRTYQETKVNIDVNRVVIREGLTQRVFDCLASASFVITSKKSVIGEFFETQGDKQEVVVFDDERHLKELINYYAVRDDARMAIVKRGRERVLAEHTYDHRIGAMFKVLSGELGKIN